MFNYYGAIVYRLGHQVFILRSWVRFPVALPSFGVEASTVMQWTVNPPSLWHAWFDPRILHQLWLDRIKVITSDCLSDYRGSIPRRVANINSLMKTINIAGVDIDIADGNIGLSISGGADSALLAYILAKYAPGPLKFYSYVSEDKFRRGEKYSRQVVDKVIELTGNNNISHDITYFQTQEYKQFIRFLMIKVMSKQVDIMYCAVTETPPEAVMESFNNKMESSVFQLRTPGILKDVYSRSNMEYNPFRNINKQRIRDIYEELGLLDTLYPLTFSCESMLDVQEHCGDCWWCEERKWAFGRYV